MLSKAETLDHIYQAFKGRPLEIDELPTFYRNPVQARGGGNVRRRMARIFRNTPASYEHILFVGYKGCGKSTELNHLQKDIQEDFLVINFSVQSELDPVHLNYIELFIVTMERLFTVAQEKKLKISEEYLKSVQYWYQTKEVQEIRGQYIDGGTEFGLGAELSVPFFASFFSKLKASAKSSRSLKETLKRNIEPKLSELIEHCNDLIRETINQEDFILAFQKLKKEYDNTIADNFVNGKLIPVENYYQALVKLYHSNTKKVDNSLEVMHLRQNLCILGYNGEGWCDVHPVVKAILKEREKVE